MSDIEFLYFFKLRVMIYSNFIQLPTNFSNMTANLVFSFIVIREPLNQSVDVSYIKLYISIAVLGGFNTVKIKLFWLDKNSFEVKIVSVF